MTDLERGLGTRWFDEVWNQGRRESIAEMLAPAAVLHEGGADCVGAEGFYPFFDRLHGAFSNFRVTVQDTIVEGDRACVRWACSCTHTGDTLGMPATHKTVHFTGISILRIADGRLVEGWQNWDMLGMLEQIQGAAKSATYATVS
ncbi:MAG TPA: ester cyclase [Bryobacteraceae bacterium]|nr:ester cyclase [Bryobacteraceae bacterium]